MEGGVTALMPRAKRDSLTAWFSLYLGVEGGPEEGNTFKAKRRDLQEFLSYFTGAVGTDHPDSWTRSHTEGFLRFLRRDRKKADPEKKQKNLSPASVNRILATLKHAAKWVHGQRPFLVGNPTERVKEITTDEPAWKGLTTLEVNRLRSAAEQLLHLQRRKNQHPLRNYAIFLLLLRTGLRESELLALELEQYDGSSLRDVQRKGKSVSRRVPVAREACEAIDRYIGEVRGREPGPLFQTRSGEPLAPQHVDRLVAQIAAQANSTLPRSEQIHLTPHVLRHTALRAAAEKKGIPYAMRLAGHTSSRYIWRYAQPSDDELDEAVEEMF